MLFFFLLSLAFIHFEQIIEAKIKVCFLKQAFQLNLERSTIGTNQNYSLAMNNY